MKCTCLTLGNLCSELDSDLCSLLCLLNSCHYVFRRQALAAENRPLGKRKCISKGGERNPPKLGVHLGLRAGRLIKLPLHPHALLGGGKESSF